MGNKTVFNELMKKKQINPLFSVCSGYCNTGTDYIGKTMLRMKSERVGLQERLRIVSRDILYIYIYIYIYIYKTRRDMLKRWSFDGRIDGETCE